MKTNLALLTIAMLSWFTTPALAQNEPQFTLVTHVEVEDVDRLVFYPEGDLVLHYWSQAHIKVEIEISAPGFRRSQVKALMPLGVFHLKTEILGQVANMEMPGLNRPMVIGGKAFKPDLKFHLSLPAHMNIQQVKIGRDTVASNM